MTDDTTHSAPQSLGQRLPLILQALKNRGLTSVVIHYRGPIMGVVFRNMQGAVVPPSPDTTAWSQQIVKVLRPILNSRYPNAAPDENYVGTFCWSLYQDTLEHQHMMVHHGL